ncbi:putative RecB family exonuclease [Ardenticatena maritima]|uniref:CRISPR-associated exonuclease Cas4 n=1 Tax=Ardenticatena maritima TaxID=872965 RepID=A0A0M9UDY0_9CHLR|nr:CRISPR-associated protein Cas4 [Ardenticatena maritima]KPL89583.1 CRISPR-associated protein Cas4 [Ardenticatena maritima]GAP64528.1 putative RecB family exonuclease [Ardenticatena maritima]
MSDRITGTLIWYAMICEREVWLMAHEIEPDRDDARLEWGRFLGEMSYPRSRKREISLSGMRLDVVERRGTRLVVGEIKASSRFVEATRMQMLFYLWRLREMGVEAEGELRFPEERRRERVVLDVDAEARLAEVLARVETILEQPLPPAAKRIRYCRACAYREFCWSDEED